MAVLGSTFPIVLMTSVDVEQHLKKKKKTERAELWNCVKVEVAFLDSPPLTVLMISVDVKQH